MKVLSLFDGISCGLCALDGVGIPVESYDAFEIDRTAIAISERNHAGRIARHGDVIGADFSPFSGYDLVMGGSPCQGFSWAGQKLNFDDPRSRLVFEFFRAVDEVRPKWFLLENVVMKKEWSDVITERLRVTPVLIDSALVSAQRRRRLYWTNIPVFGQPEDRHVVLNDILRPEDDGRYPLSAKHHAAFLKSYRNWKPSPRDGKAKTLLASYYKQPPHCPYVPDAKSESGYRMLSPVECERLQTLLDGYTEGVSKCARYRALGNGWTVAVIEHILKGIKWDT